MRQRREDLSVLAFQLLRVEALPHTLSAEAWSLLGRHDWPGNVRELRIVLLQASLSADPDRIRPEHLPPLLAEQSPRPCEGDLAHAERCALEHALDQHQGRIGQTAAALGIHRATLYRKLKRHAAPAVKSGPGVVDRGVVRTSSSR